MAAISGAVAAALALTAVSSVATIQQQRAANKANKKAAKEQEKARQDQRALQHQMRGEERREQIRAERIRRAQIEQAAENTGTAGSSGEFGAVSSVSSQFGANMGSIFGQQMHGDNITRHTQSAADYMGQAQQHQANASLWGQVGQFGSAAFQAGGGFSALGGSSTSPTGPTNNLNSNSLLKINNSRTWRVR